MAMLPDNWAFLTQAQKDAYNKTGVVSYVSNQPTTQSPLGLPTIPVGSVTNIQPMPVPPPPTPTPVTPYAGGVQLATNAKTVTGNLTDLKGNVIDPTTGTIITPAPQQEKDVTSLFQEYLSSLQPPPSTSDIYTQEYQNAGLQQKQDEFNQKQAAVKVAKAKFDAVSARLAAITKEAEAIPIRYQQESEGRGRTEAGLASLVASDLRLNALKAIPIEAEALVAQAELAAAQGDAELSQTILSQAQDHMDKIFQIRVTDAQNMHQYRTNLIDKAFEFATEEQKERLADRRRQEEMDFTIKRDAIGFQQQLVSEALSNGQGSLASRLAELDPNSSTFQSELARLAGQIRKPIDPVISGDNGLVSAIMKNPTLFNTLSASQKGELIPALSEQGFAFPRELSAVQQQTQQNAQSALLALSTFEGKIFKPDGSLNRTALLAAKTGIGGTAAAQREIIDVISRIRTGAALTTSEEAFYAKQVPNYTDSVSSAKQKILQLTAFYAGIAGSPITLKSPDGKFYRYDDMFDQNQRNEVRKLLSTGYSITDY